MHFDNQFNFDQDDSIKNESEEQQYHKVYIKFKIISILHDMNRYNFAFEERRITKKQNYNKSSAFTLQRC